MLHLSTLKTSVSHILNSKLYLLTRNPVSNFYIVCNHFLLTFGHIPGPSGQLSLLCPIVVHNKSFELLHEHFYLWVYHFCILSIMSIIWALLPAGRARSARPAGPKIALLFPCLYICASALITCAIITSRTLLPCDLTLVGNLDGCFA